MQPVFNVSLVGFLDREIIVLEFFTDTVQT